MGTKHKNNEREKVPRKDAGVEKALGSIGLEELGGVTIPAFDDMLAHHVSERPNVERHSTLPEADSNMFIPFDSEEVE